MRRSIWRRIASLTLGCLLAPAALWAADAPQPAAPQPQSPFNLSFGPQKDGGFGAVLKGDKSFHIGTPHFPASATAPYQMLSPYGELTVDAAWSSAEGSLNNSALSFRPSLALQRVHPGAAGKPPTSNGPWLLVGVDLRQRFGRFKDGEEVKDVNQTILGGSVELRWASLEPWLQSYANGSGKLNQVPTLSLTYYDVQDSGADEATLPEGLKANVIQARLRAALTLAGVQCTATEVPPSGDADDVFGAGKKISCPWEISVDLTATKPTQGAERGLQFLYDLALSYDTGGTLKPVIRYRSGDEHGLEYDEQMILGLLWDPL